MWRGEPICLHLVEQTGWATMYRFFLIAGLLVLFYYLIRKAIRELGRYGASRGLPKDTEGGNQMVQDPVCRVFVPRETAVTEEMGGQTYFFCSRGCATVFRKQLSA